MKQKVKMSSLSEGDIFLSVVDDVEEYGSVLAFEDDAVLVEVEMEDGSVCVEHWGLDFEVFLSEDNDANQFVNELLQTSDKIKKIVERSQNPILDDDDD